MRIRKLCSVTHQAAGFGIGAQGIDHWHGMARGQRDELYATVDEEVVGMDHKCVGPLLHKARKGRVDLGSRAGGEELDLRTNGRRRSLHIFLQRFSSRILQIGEHPKVRGCRQQLVQEPEPLGYQLVAHGVDTGDVAARSAEALDKAKLNRSKPRLKTIGIVVVAALAASAAAELPGVAMTATRRRTRSATNSGIRERSFSAQRYSIATF